MLSGGQRQRITIARAFIKNAPILIMDEATSALDSDSESAIQDALRTLVQNKTVLMIAHRVSTLLMMDRIIVIENATIVEDGTHDELLARQGPSAALWKLQTGDFIEG
jgi:ABC-type multidrug transport system fused ATPase/permease subunit